MNNAAALWTNASGDDPKALQTALFPNGLVWDGAGFGTVTTCIAFGQLEGLRDAKNGLASPPGFEGTLPVLSVPFSREIEVRRAAERAFPGDAPSCHYALDSPAHRRHGVRERAFESGDKVFDRGALEKPQPAQSPR